jgi:hypothetical protein
LSPDPLSFEIQLTRVFLTLVTLLVPIAHIFLLMALYVAPLTLFSQWKLFYAVELISAWSALDLFCISVFSNVLELDELAKAVSKSIPLPDELEPIINELGGIIDLNISING